MNVFNADYAAAYDELYREKDYEAECDVLEQVFKGRQVKRVLDLGCGTGNHVLPLARRGYEVAGVDRSPHMLDVGRRKASAAGLEARFVEGDVRTVDVGASFDAVLVMFAVLGYQLANDDVLATLNNARRHLEPGGLLIFDVWYGPAVLTQRPGDRVKVVETGEGRILRATSARLDVDRHLCEMSYRLWRLGGDESEETREVHRMRFFFPQELRLFLDVTGFSLRSLTAFPSLETPCDETTWNALAVAEVVSVGGS